MDKNIWRSFTGGNPECGSCRYAPQTSARSVRRREIKIPFSKATRAVPAVMAAGTDLGSVGVLHVPLRACLGSPLRVTRRYMRPVKIRSALGRSLRSLLRRIARRRLPSRKEELVIRKVAAKVRSHYWCRPPPVIIETVNMINSQITMREYETL